MGNLGRNIRFALRQQGRNRGFTVTVIATLALAIGANTAIFSVVNALMLKSLPYAHPDRLGAIFLRVQGASESEEHHWIDGEQWELLRDNVPALLSAVSSGVSSGVNLQADGTVQYVHDARVSAHYLDVLQIHPSLGRNFSEIEDRPNGPPAVLLSYALWRNTFDANRDLIGRTILLKGAPYTVIGVLPRDARTPLNADLYTALQPSRTGEGAGTNFDVIVRLRDGATWQQADAQINRAWSGIAQQFAREEGPGARVSFATVPLQKGQTAELRPKAIALMSAAGFILFIACANLAGLTLVRMTRRTPEVATRLALGASHWHIQKQFWIESLLLAGMGGAAGVAVGFAALRALLAMLPPGYLPIGTVHLDLRVLAFTAVVAGLTSIAFGMLPALAVRKVNLRSSMVSRSVAGSDKLRLRQFLIAGEVALTVILLAGSGLLIRTLIHLETLPPGFNPNGLIVAKASLDDARYHDPAAFHRLLDQSTAAMRQIPGVQNAAVALSLPYERIVNDTLAFGDGVRSGQAIQTDEDYVTPGFFGTLQIPILAGRFFTASDGPDTQPVAIVNRTFAQKFYPHASPVGHTLRSGKTALQIIGVVADTPISSGLDPVAPLQSEQIVYVPAAQMNSAADLAVLHTWFQPSWVIRTAAPISGVSAQMQYALSSVAPGLPFSGFYSMNDLMHQTLAMQRIEVALLGVMAAVALLLSAVGIFALVANIVAQRTRELGIRMALGSSVPQAMAHVAGSGMRASVAGLALGLAFSLGVLRILRSVLYGVSVYDVPTLALVVLVLLAITCAATAMPALRIARIDPARTLREE